MNVLVTGGAGFIGRWVVKRLLEKKINTWVIDNLDNGNKDNLKEFKDNVYLKEMVVGDIRDASTISKLFETPKFDICLHLAAQINVQESIENPKKAFEVNLLGTYNILEQAQKYRTKIVLISTCMVYDLASANKAINEDHAVKPLSPYAGSKLAAENLVESYSHAYNLPILILRPFNTYGPFQKSNMEGGVISIFLKKTLEGKKLQIYGDGTQTRDFLYVEDCADFIVKAALSKEAEGKIINVGLGQDISINELALLISKNKSMIEYVPHHHPQAEIAKLLCNPSKAKKLLNWMPKSSLEEGILKTKKWIKSTSA